MEQFTPNDLTQNYELGKLLAKRLNDKGIADSEVAKFTPAKLCLEADATMEEAQQISVLPKRQTELQNYPLFRAQVALHMMNLRQG